MEEIINRVSSSSLLSIDMDEFIDQSERMTLDLRDFLYEGVLLKEREFRAAVKSHSWEVYNGMNVMIVCSEDTLIPSWAYMIIASKLSEANLVVLGNEESLETKLIDDAISKILKMDLSDAKVVIKGCGNLKMRDYAYFELTKSLLSLVSSIMYGEPCSTLPVYKRPKSD